MNAVAPHDLKELLTIQAKLLDSYLRQNLGKQFAYALYAVPVDLCGPVMGASNIHAPLIEDGAALIVAQLLRVTHGAQIAIESEPRIVQRFDLLREAANDSAPA